MNNVVFINNQEVVFENKDEQVFCTSLDVAKFLERIIFMF